MQQNRVQIQNVAIWFMFKLTSLSTQIILCSVNGSGIVQLYINKVNLDLYPQHIQYLILNELQIYMWKIKQTVKNQMALWIWVGKDKIYSNQK